MRSSRVGILSGLALLLSLGQVSSVAGPRYRVPHGLPLHFGKVMQLLDHGNGTAASSNWSGYVVLGSSFEWVTGSWVVPAAKCNGGNGNKFASFWVGLDGYNSSTVEQIGTLTNCAGSSPYYYAWYEFYPQGSIIIPSVPVKPGDRISAAVTFHSNTKQFDLAIKNHTTGLTYNVNGAVSGAIRSSAEWVAEAPCCTSTGGILPMTDFGTVTFGKESTGVTGTNYALDPSSTGSIGTFPPVNIILIDKSSSPTSMSTSSCSRLSTAGTSFACIWKAQ